MINPIQPSFTNRYSYSEPRHQQIERQDDSSAKTVLAAGVLQAAAMALQTASNWCSNKLMQGKEFTSSENIQKVADSMSRGLDVTVDFIDKNNIRNYSQELQQELIPVAKGENAFYANELKLAVAPKSKPSLILHELGHAINANKGRFLRFLQKSRVWAASVPTLLVMLNDTFKQNKQSNDKTFFEKHAGKIGFAAFIPTIIEEGLASIRGARAAKKVLGKTVNLKPLKRNYFFAWMTYVIAGLGLGVAAKQSVLMNKEKSQ